MGTSSRDLLVRVVGPYQGSNPRVRSFLERIIRDAQGDHALRTTALGEYARGANASDRLSMAETLFWAERDAAIRREAVDLASTNFPGKVEPEIESKAFDLLAWVAREDVSGDVRGAAGRALLLFPARKALETTAKLLKTEKDASVRADILGGIRWGMFFKDEREELHGAQDLAAQHFLADPDDEVQRAAIRAYLDLIWCSLWVHDDSGSSLDPRGIESIRTMVEKIQKKPLSREMKAFIKGKLAKDFEKRIPELAASGDYAELKRYLEK